MVDDDGYIYKYVEECTDCDICFDKNQEFFKCNICLFKTCPRCFSNIYFVETSKCPQCRIIIN